MGEPKASFAAAISLIALLIWGGLAPPGRAPQGSPWPPCAAPALNPDGLIRCDGQGRALPAALALLLRVRVDVNHADAGELSALPGIGPVLAERLLRARAARPDGRFATLAELGEVPGVGPRLLDRLAPLITLSR
jgi:competence protein ComEA